MELIIDKETIENLEERLVEGIKNNELHFLDQVLHDDLLFIAPNGQIITKAMDLSSHRNRDMVVEELVTSIEEIRIIGDTAIVVLIYNTKGTMLGNPIQGKFRYIRVWKLFQDGLKVIAGSCILINS